MDGSAPRSPDAGRWNHNIHYHPVVLRSIPAGAERALDVGCGEGMLARELRRSMAHVVGIDLDEASIELARRHEAPALEYIVGNVLTHPFEPASFDVVVSVASLHHMDVAIGLRRMRELLRPGGLLAVVGLARSRQPVDLPLDIAGLVADRIHKRSKTEWNHSAPNVSPAPLTFAQTRRVAVRQLPGVAYRRHLLWRYSLLWTKPAP